MISQDETLTWINQNHEGHQVHEVGSFVPFVFFVVNFLAQCARISLIRY